MEHRTDPCIICQDKIMEYSVYYQYAACLPGIPNGYSTILILSHFGLDRVTAGVATLPAICGGGRTVGHEARTIRQQDVTSAEEGRS